MATSASGSERIVNRVMEGFTSSPSIDSLIEEVVNLLGQSVIAQHAEAKQLLESRLDQVSYRNGTDPLEGEENKFYNLSKKLVDSQGKVNEACLKLLKPIDLGDSLEKKTINGLIKRLEHQEDRMSALAERTEKLLRTIEAEREPLSFVSQDHYDHSRPYEICKTVFDAVKHKKCVMSPEATFDQEGIWHLNNSRVAFLNSDLLPDHNFIITLFFKTTQTNCGLFSIGGDGCDRHFCLKNGQPFHRLYNAAGWSGTTTKELNDRKWHKWELVVQDNQGQSAYIDGELVGKNAYDHSDFDWKSEVIIGYSSDATIQFIGKMKEITISAIKPHVVVFDAFKEKERVMKYGAQGVSCAFGAWQIKSGSWIGFTGVEFLPDRNFKISLCFKTVLGTCGIFSYTGGGHDRHFCLKDGKPYQRVSQTPGNAWIGSTSQILTDNNWHKWDLVVRDGSGQKSYIDGELIGEHPYNHSDFTSKTHLTIGYSDDQQPSFEGKIKNVFVYAL